MPEGSSTPVSISELKRETHATDLVNIEPGFGNQASFELMQRGARVLSQSSLVPREFQGSEGFANAIVALNMALRMKADPLMVCQNLYVVHGRPAWSAQFLIATFNRSGRYSAMRYEWQGKRGDKDWGCRAWAKELATGDRIEGPLVTMETAKAEGWLDRGGSKWKTIPELMLTYRAAAWFVRTNAPEIAMGLPTSDELDDVVTLTPAQYTKAQIEGDEHTRPPVDVTGTGTAAAVDPLATEPKQGLAYDYVAKAIGNATTKDGLALARDMIRSVADDDQKSMLRALADKRDEEIEA
jgi:hypothetical protein